ncbi:uncharacterized protein LOC132921642 isoform X1 [Rhopalosiphum padi]|uniref:uncharacterized protein LOC132921642 isoform X1 n=2 Tax=Rhopalosiphum padi TaxID=40932 RepID=UPI00298DFA2E|nr:uncharacterized protein LOC132921642 isoform X1 [Rhopalosiphum padi]XP_060840771.1 uncharacterized protein LOC132921642 isoform X1 [Rhopalosiphum padi]XP_060840780.1 uncharacterized protein LOC132921642 isoform X1 [Rhopalosiphum padi]
MEEEGFKFKHISKEDFNKTYKKINRCRQKQIDDQHWNVYMESIKSTDSKKTYTIENNTDIKQSENSFNKYRNSQSSMHDSINLYSLHDPYDINHIHGLRNRLFKTFIEFSNILENALLPPVLKSAKKVRIKINEYDQQTNNYIFDLNSLFYDIKKESKNEDLHNKKNKTNVTLRKAFQIKLIKCYKLAINATKMCSKTLEAGIYNPIQNKMKNLIQIISALSLTTGKYIYGEIFKKKKKESFDLVQHCKDLENMLEECGYKDTDIDNHSNNINSNILNELSNKALSKPKTQLFSANSNRLSMYNHDKPKLGSCYAQGWSKKSFESSRNKVLSKQDNILKTNNNLDDIKTVMEEYPFGEMNETNYKFLFKEIQDEKLINTNEAITFSTDSKIVKSNKLKTTSNVGLYIIQENIWRKFPIKNIKFSQNGCMVLNITPQQTKELYLYKRQFKQQSLIAEHDVNILFNISETIMDDLINEVLSKIDYDAIIKNLIKMELLE